MKVRAHVLVTGRVQGVFFRSETAYKARKSGINGWVQNTQDDKVEALFEGEEKAVKEVIKFCKRGPPAARVMNVEVTWEDYTGNLRGFKIKHDF